ncbi:serine/threonine-protein kinase [Thermoactinospora rubra]|uniref:serine/threonine-protein kinase n=1 Tax=Thermoactinospora rubra TaxID=1088767 RepID=UPI000A1069EE|nr:serine/threonine-protein kinase [Thermoactinospora rubra]
MSGGRLAGRYTLIRRLGSGGMGTVWHARDEMLDRDVAVKELTLPEGIDPALRQEMLTRAVREAQVTGGLRHPGIVALHDVVVEHGRPWLVMELLRGRTLGDAVRQHGPMAPEQAARIGADVLEALAAAHAQGLQHRDVKPGNVFLTDSGRVVLTDFGIARQEGQATLTQAGTMIGSPGFIAPERLEGHPGGPASDLWSLGATLFYAVEGRSAYEGGPAERIRATLSAPPPPARGPLGPLIAAMMARHPAARPDAATAIHALRQLAAGQAVHVSEATVPSRRPRRTKLVVALVCAAALLVAGSVTALTLTGRTPAKPTAYTVPFDVCGLLTGEQTAQLLGTSRTVKPLPGNGEEGPLCGWALPQIGVQVQVQKDSDAPHPWAMTAQRARSLLISQARDAERMEETTWGWPEIGVKGVKAKRTPVRWFKGLGEEAFAFELAGPDGRVHTAVVFFRAANLVFRVDHTTLLERATDETVKQTGLRAATLVEEALTRVR